MLEIVHPAQDAALHTSYVYKYPHHAPVAYNI